MNYEVAALLIAVFRAISLELLITPTVKGCDSRVVAIAYVVIPFRRVWLASTIELSDHTKRHPPAILLAALLVTELRDEATLDRALLVVVLP